MLLHSGRLHDICLKNYCEGNIKGQDGDDKYYIKGQDGDDKYYLEFPLIVSCIEVL